MPMSEKILLISILLLITGSHFFIYRTFCILRDSSKLEEYYLDKSFLSNMFGFKFTKILNMLVVETLTRPQSLSGINSRRALFRAVGGVMGIFGVMILAYLKQ